MPDHLAAVVLAIVLFPLVIWVPGMVLGYCTNVLEFRTRSISTRVSLGLLFSLLVCPIAVYLCARFGGFHAVWAGYGIVWATAAVLALAHARAIASAAAGLLYHHRAGLLLVLGWTLFCVVWEVGFVTSYQVWRPLNTMDAIAHVAFTDAITRTGIPPVNPFVYPGFPLPLFYYYGWYLICSVVNQVGGSMVTSRAAVQAGTVFVGLAVAACVAMYVEILGTRIFPDKPRVRWGVAVGLLAVTGLDLIPWAFLEFLKRTFDKGSGGGPSIEHWNEQVTAWLGAILMSPHHPLAMAICFTAALLIFSTAGSSRLIRIVVVGLGLASATAISAYVVLAFAAGLAVWCLVALRRRWWNPLVNLCASGALAGVLYAPFAAELRASSSETRLPLALTVRAFLPVDYWLPSIFKFLTHTPAAIYALRTVLLPVNYFLELGFFLVAAIVYWRWRASLRRTLGPEESMLACTFAGSVLVCTFLKSTLRWNDLGWRGFLVAQFVLILWAAPVAGTLLPRVPKMLVLARWRPLLVLCFAIGAAGTLVEMGNMRFRFDGLHGPQSIADRDAYIWIDAHTPKNAVVLFNPNVYLDYFSSLYGNRQQLYAGEAYGTFFSTGTAGMALRDQASRLFRHDAQPQEMVALCDRYLVSVILVQQTDPLWSDRQSWVWKATPAFANERTRVFLIDALRLMPGVREGSASPR